MYRITRLSLTGLLMAAAVALAPAEAHAQRARARGPVRVVRPVVVRTYVHRPYLYDRYHWSLGLGWGTYYGYPHWYQRHPYPPYRYYDDYGASARIEVKPRDAQVYVDGYFAGSVDDFDGIFQRLHLRPGQHVLEIYKEGYRTIREQVDFRPGETYRVKLTMEPLGPGDPSPERPAPDPANVARAEGAEPGAPSAGGREPIVRGDGGAVAIRVQPSGAIVTIDGERWDAPDGPEPLVVHLSEGSHRVEVRKDGYRPFATEIRVRRGETVPLNISLR